MNLLDYLDKPEMLQHIDGEGILGLMDLGERGDGKRILIGFDNGFYGMYSLEGVSVGGSDPAIILKPKPKKVVKGYRKAVMYYSGNIKKDTIFRPSKEDFENYWYTKATPIGEWEEIEYEIQEGE